MYFPTKGGRDGPHFASIYRLREVSGKKVERRRGGGGVRSSSLSAQLHFPDEQRHSQEPGKPDCFAEDGVMP